MASNHSLEGGVRGGESKPGRGRTALRRQRGAMAAVAGGAVAGGGLAQSPPAEPAQAFRQLRPLQRDLPLPFPSSYSPSPRTGHATCLHGTVTAAQTGCKTTVSILFVPSRPCSARAAGPWLEPSPLAGRGRGRRRGEVPGGGGAPVPVGRTLHRSLGLPPSKEATHTA